VASCLRSPTALVTACLRSWICRTLRAARANSFHALASAAEIVFLVPMTYAEVQVICAQVPRGIGENAYA
jgi:hypothetical protein